MQELANSKVPPWAVTESGDPLSPPTPFMADLFLSPCVLPWHFGSQVLAEFAGGTEECMATALLVSWLLAGPLP